MTNEPRASARGRDFVPKGESLLILTRPGFAFVLLYRQMWWLIPVAAAFIVHSIASRIWTPDPISWLVWAAWAWLILGLGWRIIAWRSRAYIVTDARIIVRAGVLRRVGADVPLRRIQHTTLSQSLIEQMFNLGTVGIATAGADGAVINLLMVPAPKPLIALLRDAAQRAPSRPPTSPLRNSPSPHLPILPILGLAGGIGSGKSEVARILTSLGCFVIDSDKEAKEALDRPQVRDQLIQWWGRGILHPDGKVNRKAIADIIFKSDKDRAALEALIHPMVRARRSDLRAQAQKAGAKAAVIDAPLLYEAGVDAECDAVIFVDAPRQLRLSRIQATRHWDEAELSRREAAQLPLEDKRRRSTVVIVNDASTDELRTRVAAALRKLIPPAK